MQGKVLTVASGKGGVGKTTTAVNLAVALWRDGQAVALVDADLGMANVAAVLALEPAATLHDVLSGEATLEEAIIEANDGDLLVLPGERDLAGFADADPAVLRSVLADLAGRCDYVVVDTGAGLSHEDVLPLGLADEVLLVTTPDPAAIGDTRKTLQLAGLLEGPVVGVVVTRALEGTDAGSIATEIGVELLGTIPEDPAVTESTTRGDPLESHAPDAPATAAYRDLATSIAGTAAPGDDASGEESTDEAAADASDPDVSAFEGGAGGDHREADGTAVDPDDDPGEGHDGHRADAEEEEGAATGSDASSGEADETAAEAVESDTGGDANEDEGGRNSDGDGAGGAAGSDESDEDGPETTTESEAKRGGFFGWLGRLFS